MFHHILVNDLFLGAEMDDVRSGLGEGAKQFENESDANNKFEMPHKLHSTLVDVCLLGVIFDMHDVSNYK